MKTEVINNNPLLKLVFEFSLMILSYCEVLQDQRKYVLSNQLLKSGTSIGANAMEAQNAESKADFVHKIKLAAKEADETQYWLFLCSASKNYPDCAHLIKKLEEIQKILNANLGTARKNNS